MSSRNRIEPLHKTARDTCRRGDRDREGQCEVGCPELRGCGFFPCACGALKFSSCEWLGWCSELL